MQEPFDWEEKMEATRRSAQAASQNSENTIAAMARLLNEMSRLLHMVETVKENNQAASGRLGQQVAHIKSELQRKENHIPPSFRLLAWSWGVAFALGAAFGAFIAS